MPQRAERDRRQQILDAAFDRFARYGFRNTSIDDIARTAGISRPLVYQHFANKEEVFRALAGQLHDRVIEEAADRLDAPATDLPTQVAGALTAKLCVLEQIDASEHHDELMDTSSRLAGDLASTGTERFDALVRKRLTTARREGELPPRAAAIPVTQLARLLREAASGVAKATPEGNWRGAVLNLTRLTLAKEET